MCIWVREQLAIKNCGDTIVSLFVSQQTPNECNDNGCYRNRLNMHSIKLLVRDILIGFPPSLNNFLKETDYV